MLTTEEKIELRKLREDVETLSEALWLVMQQCERFLPRVSEDEDAKEEMRKKRMELKQLSRLNF